MEESSDSQRVLVIAHMQQSDDAYRGCHLIELRDRREEYTLPVNEWARRQRGNALCPTCYKLRRAMFPKPLDVPIRSLPDRTPYHGVFQGGVAVIRLDLLEWLHPHLPAHSIGRCYDRDGQERSDYKSIHFERFITRRSGQNADNYNWYRCKTCGVLGISSDDEYVLRREMPVGDVFQDAISCLYLSEELAHRFPFKRFPELETVPYPVRDVPVADDPYPEELPLQGLSWGPLFTGKLAFEE